MTKLEIFYIIMMMFCGLANVFLTGAIIMKDYPIEYSLVYIGLIWLMYGITFGSLIFVIKNIDKG